MIRAEKYFRVFQLSFIHHLKNYKALIGLSVFLLTCLLIFAHLWKAAAVQTEAFGLFPHQLLWYITFNEWVLISLPDIQEDIEEDLRSGKLAYLLPRPISYLGATFCEGLGVLVINLFVLGIVSFTFTRIYMGPLPFDLKAFPFLLVLGVFAGGVGLIFQMLVGISAFWLQQVSPFHWIWEKLLFTLGGLLLPLAAYPEGLQQVAALTPFPAILGGRSALAIDFSFGQAFALMGILLFWGLVGVLGLTFLYRKGLKRMNMEGG